jgi:hypothetical protein
VVRELFANANESVLVIRYAVCQGREVFRDQPCSAMQSLRACHLLLRKPVHPWPAPGLPRKHSLRRPTHHIPLPRHSNDERKHREEARIENPASGQKADKRDRSGFDESREEKYEDPGGELVWVECSASEKASGRRHSPRSGRPIRNGLLASGPAVSSSRRSFASAGTSR